MAAYFFNWLDEHQPSGLAAWSPTGQPAAARSSALNARVTSGTIRTSRVVRCQHLTEPGPGFRAGRGPRADQPAPPLLQAGLLGHRPAYRRLHQLLRRLQRRREQGPLEQPRLGFNPRSARDPRGVRAVLFRAGERGAHRRRRSRWAKLAGALRDNDGVRDAQALAIPEKNRWAMTGWQMSCSAPTTTPTSESASPARTPSNRRPWRSLARSASVPPSPWPRPAS